MIERSLNPKEVIDLLAKLKNQTPDYPQNLIAARKAAFLKQVVAVKIDGKGQGGQHGGSGGPGGSGPVSGSGLAAKGFLWQTLIGIGMIVAMLLATFAYRDQIVDLLAGNDVTALVETAIPSNVSPPAIVPVSTPSAPTKPTSTASPTEVVPTGTTTILDDTTIDDYSIFEEAPGDTKDNPGLHLGETPGTPAAPGQGNPGNVNKPEKPKPEKPEKPEKPQK